MTLDGDETLRELLFGRWASAQAWDNLYRVDLFADVRFPDGHVFEDIATTHRLVMRAVRVACVPDDQMCLSLFNDAEAWADAGEPEPGLSGAEGAPRKPGRRGGRRRIGTSKLERVTIEHDLEDRACPACGSEMSRMKVEVTEVVGLVPAHLVVEEHRRHVYRCKSCCDANAAGEEVASQIVRAPMPALTPLPHSFATASMPSWVISAKYANSMPYHRLEQDLRSIGAEVSRKDMANWTIGAHERWLSLIHARMREGLLGCRYPSADEAEAQVLREPGREPKQKSHMWLFRTGPHEVPICVLEYRPTRSGAVPRAFLEAALETSQSLPARSRQTSRRFPDRSQEGSESLPRRFLEAPIGSPRGARGLACAYTSYSVAACWPRAPAPPTIAIDPDGRIVSGGRSHVEDAPLLALTKLSPVPPSW